MASFTLPNYPMLTPEQANPFAGAVKTALDVYQKSTQNAFLQPNLKQALIAKQLENIIAGAKAKYAEPKEQASLAYEQERAPNLRAQTGLTQEQTKWFGPTSQSQIALNQALAGLHGVEAQQSALKLKFLKEKLGEGGGGNTNGGTGGGMGSGNAATEGGASGGNTPTTSEGSSTAASTNAVYGIETPKPNEDDIVNQMLLGIDTFSPRQQNAKEQQQNQFQEYQKKIAQSVETANDATRLKQILLDYNKYMDQAKYKGPALGNIPSSGWQTLLLGNMTPEQLADRKSQTLVQAGINELPDALKRNGASDADVAYAATLKVDRKLTDEARRLQTQWMNGVFQRQQEQSEFYTVLGNSRKELKTTADAAWTAYQKNFPLISGDSGKEKFNVDNLNKWWLYATPEAIESIKKTGDYKPSKSQRNNFLVRLPPTSQYPEGRTVPVKEKDIVEVIKRGGKLVQ